MFHFYPIIYNISIQEKIIQKEKKKFKKEKIEAK